MTINNLIIIIFFLQKELYSSEELSSEKYVLIKDQNVSAAL